MAPTVSIYGDFNCPFSALASARAARLEERGVLRVEWCAVEHDPDIPHEGVAVRGEVADELDRELEQIRSLLLDDEPMVLRRPDVRSNTATAVSRYAALPPARRASVRADLFEAYWVHGYDLGDARRLDAIVGTDTRADVAARWRQEWLDASRPIVPLMRLADGRISRGLGALARLADLLSAPRA